jgi:hypothetical protein
LGETYGKRESELSGFMDQIELLAQIRSLVRVKLLQFGGSAEAGPNEAMLIRDGYFCGRRFECDGLGAVWFVEENEIKFYDRAGGILEVLELTPDSLASADSERRAA